MEHYSKENLIDFLYKEGHRTIDHCGNTFYFFIRTPILDSSKEWMSVRIRISDVFLISVEAKNFFYAVNKYNGKFIFKKEEDKTLCEKRVETVKKIVDKIIIYTKEWYAPQSVKFMKD